MTPEERELRRALEARSGEPSPQFRARVTASFDTSRPSSSLMPAIAAVVAVVLAVGTVGALVLSRSARNSGQGTETRYTVNTPSTVATCPTHPQPMMGASMAYDEARSELVLFGGDGVWNPSDISLDQTWVRSKGCWSLAKPALSPPRRGFGAMAYDPIRKVTVLYGGQQDVAGKAPVFLNDTWLWDGANWTKVDASPSPAVWSAVGAFDVASGQFIVYGNYVNGPPAQTWAWNGTKWTQLHPTTSPPPRAGASLAYDPSSRKLVLFGGFSSGGGRPANDTWTWDGANWTQEQPVRSPAQYYFNVVCSGLMPILVGTESAADTWQWDGRDWKVIPTTQHPISRLYASCTFTGTETYLFGGGAWGSGGLLSDLWVFRDHDWHRVEATDLAASRARTNG